MALLEADTILVIRSNLTDEDSQEVKSDSKTNVI